ncbi:hypothetical protein I4F81_010468 [Pyropia yezoensis]|uniref:Uncharacterized protein n=1 Tax=Pyropia yezoensis TaxID=2788 RepID=A0ACC3CDA2_PYRYE|nr:hypothetical protein I4F81_010468 [Neopyropia yezoensis]
MTMKRGRAKAAARKYDRPLSIRLVVGRLDQVPVNHALVYVKWKVVSPTTAAAPASGVTRAVAVAGHAADWGAAFTIAATAAVRAADTAVLLPVVLRLSGGPADASTRDAGGGGRSSGPAAAAAATTTAAGAAASAEGAPAGAAAPPPAPEVGLPVPANGAHERLGVVELDVTDVAAARGAPVTRTALLQESLLNATLRVTLQVRVGAPGGGRPPLPAPAGAPPPPVGGAPPPLPATTAAAATAGGGGAVAAAGLLGVCSPVSGVDGDSFSSGGGAAAGGGADADPRLSARCRVAVPPAVVASRVDAAGVVAELLAAAAVVWAAGGGARGGGGVGVGAAWGGGGGTGGDGEGREGGGAVSSMTVSGPVGQA